jgi:hypothetical protein
MPWSAAKIWPRLWLNPWATHPLPIDSWLPIATIDERGSVSYHDVDQSPANVLGLPDDWPGPEDPFETPACG